MTASMQEISGHHQLPLDHDQPDDLDQPDDHDQPDDRDDNDNHCDHYHDHVCEVKIKKKIIKIFLHFSSQSERAACVDSCAHTLYARTQQVVVVVLSQVLSASLVIPSFSHNLDTPHARTQNEFHYHNVTSRMIGR